MARVRAILGALARVLWRDIGKLNALAANNLFLFCFLALGQSGAFLQIILGLLVVSPLSADPLRNVPPTRLALWPLTRTDRVLLRAASLCLNPAIWIALALLVWLSDPALGVTALALAFAGYASAPLFARLKMHVPQTNLMRYVPAAPGRWGGLVRKNIREMLSVLDPYAAILLAISGVAYRLLASHPDRDALFGITLLVSLALSTYAQCLFALDGETGFERYHLFPLRGWQILAAKDAAFLVILTILVLPLAPAAGLAAALVALAVGHHPSVFRPAPQPRWRFTGGTSIVLGLVQVILMFSAAAVVFRTSLAFLSLCAAAWLLSLWYFGRRLEDVP